MSAEGHQHRSAARGAIARLLTGEELSRAEVFGGGDEAESGKTWQRRVLGRLCELKLVERTGGTVGRYVRYTLADADDARGRLEAMARDDAAVDRLVSWLGVEPANGALPPVPEGAEADGDETGYEVVIKLLAAVLENVVYTRERQDAMIARFDTLEKEVAEMVDVVKEFKS